MDKVLIAGAGPTGLTLALWLTGQGVPVRVIDEHGGPGTESRAMVVHARTLEVLDTFRAIVDKTFSFLKTAVVAVIGFVKNHWQLIGTVLLGPLFLVAVQVVKHWSAIRSAFMGGVNAVIGFVKSHWQAILATLIGGPFGLAVLYVVKNWDKISGAVQAGVGRHQCALADLAGRSLQRDRAARREEIARRTVEHLDRAPGLAALCRRLVDLDLDRDRRERRCAGRDDLDDAGGGGTGGDDALREPPEAGGRARQ